MRMYGTAHKAKSKLDLERERHMVSIKERAKRVRWGRWYLVEYRVLNSIHDKNVALCIEFAPGYIYDIELYTCRTDRARQLWLDHMAEKSLLISPRDVDDMARAFNDLVQQGILKS